MVEIQPMGRGVTQLCVMTLSVTSSFLGFSTCGVRNAGKAHFERVAWEAMRILAWSVEHHADLKTAEDVTGSRFTGSRAITIICTLPQLGLITTSYSSSAEVSAAHASGMYMHGVLRASLSRPVAWPGHHLLQTTIDFWHIFTRVATNLLVSSQEAGVL